MNFLNGKKGDKPDKSKGDRPTGASFNPSNSSCYSCEGTYKMLSCKFLPICQEVIKSLKAKVVDSQQGNLKMIIAAAIFEKKKKLLISK